MTKSKLRRILSLLFLFCSPALGVLAGCRYQRSTPQPPPPEQQVSVPEQDYIDLKPGWRLRVVFPILRSGGYIAVSKDQAPGNDVKVSDDFLGYEMSYYKVTAAKNNAVRIEFIKAEVWEKGKFHSRSQTLLPLFIKNMGQIRLVFFIRASQADHNMAVVTASDPGTLEASTKAVISEAVCQSASGSVCSWVPGGVAVIPEEEQVVKGKKQWVPAR